MLEPHFDSAVQSRSMDPAFFEDDESRSDSEVDEDEEKGQRLPLLGVHGKKIFSFLVTFFLLDRFQFENHEAFCILRSCIT